MFLVLTTSGIARYFAPRCRDANWAGWNALGLGKDEWAAMHILSAALFLAIVAVHVIFNWRQLLSYVRMSRAGGAPYWREAVGAVGATVLVVCLSAALLPPASSIANYSEHLQDQFAAELKPATPWRHAENASLTELAARLDVPLKSVLAALNTGGPPAHAEDTLRDLAKRRHTAPMTLFRQLRHGLGRCGNGPRNCSDNGVKTQ
jgi:hypothetical protein